MSSDGRVRTSRMEICDMPGIQAEGGITLDDIRYLLRGQVKDGHQVKVLNSYLKHNK